MTEPTPPSDTFTIQVNGEPREIFMSFGLLNELSTMMSDVENLPLIHLDPVIRENVMQTLLGKRDDKGTIVEPINLMTAKMSIDETRSLMNWVVEHIMNFLLSSLEETRMLTERHQARIKALVPDSPSSTTGTAS